MDVAVLVLDGVFDTGLAAISDAIATANALIEAPRRPIRLTRIALRRRIRTAHGLTVPVAPVPRSTPDFVVVPALGAKDESSLDAALAQREVEDAGELLREWSRARTRIAAACTSTFVVAQAGLLDDQRATTTWWLAPGFRRRFPRVRLEEARMIVEAKKVTTAGAALAHLDLALWLVRRRSPSLARSTARHLAFDRAPSQGAYVMPDHVHHTDELVDRFETWARGHLASFSVSTAARAIGASERTLERRVNRVLGKSPLSFVQDLRVEAARNELETTDRGLQEIAARVGYADATTLRTLLRRKTGLGLKELRARAGR